MESSMAKANSSAMMVKYKLEFGLMGKELNGLIREAKT
jgi:hypothetical protein